MKEQGQTDDEIKSFAKFYYQSIARSPNQDDALDEFINNFKHMYPFESRIVPQVVAPESQESSIEDVMEEDKPEEQKLSERQLKHISEVVKIIEKEPKLKEDIKRTMTEELTKGTINPAEFTK